MTALDDYLRTVPGRCQGCGFDLEHQGCRCEGSDWDVFVAAVKRVARNGVVHQNAVRPLVRGRIAPKKIGPLYWRAQSCGFMTKIGEEPSRDTHGKNTHHSAGIYQLAS